MLTMKNLLTAKKRTKVQKGNLQFIVLLIHSVYWHRYVWTVRSKILKWCDLCRKKENGRSCSLWRLYLSVQLWQISLVTCSLFISELLKKVVEEILWTDVWDLLWYALTIYDITCWISWSSHWLRFAKCYLLGQLQPGTNPLFIAMQTMYRFISTGNGAQTSLPDCLADFRSG